MACIYVVKNKTNNKIYVGQTTKTSLSRFNSHAYDNLLLGRAIRKYGKPNFFIKEYTDIRLNWLDWAEQEMIKKYNCVAPNGYNLHLGGQANRLVSKETRKKISIGRKGQISPNKGKKLSAEQIEKSRLKHIGHKWTEEQKLNLSRIRKAHPEKYASRTGKLCSEETKKKMSESAKKVIHTKEHNEKVAQANKGRIINQAVKDKQSKVQMLRGKSCIDIKIVNKDTGKIFDYAREVFDKYGIKRTALQNCLNKKGSTSGGYHWELLEVYK